MGTNNSVVTLELPFSEHVEELRQRIFLIVGVILLFTLFAFVEVKSLVKILELPINNVKFFQSSPGEYFISTVKISFYTGLLFSSPVAIGQLILFLLPGLTKKETKIILPLLISSLVLFGLGLAFSYYTLVPAALNFFLNYSEEVLEPFWSFDQYFEFILVLYYRISLSDSYYSNFSRFTKYRFAKTNVRCLALCHIDFNNSGGNFNTFN